MSLIGDFDRGTRPVRDPDSAVATEPASSLRSETSFTDIAPSNRIIVTSLVVGLVLRLVLCIMARNQTPWTDMATYRDIALSILGGQALHTIDRPLLYPLFLSTVFRTIGDTDLLFAYLVQAALSMATVVAIAYYARAILTQQSARWALLLLPPQLAFAQYSALLLSETVFSLLFVLWIVFFLSSARSDVSIASRVVPRSALLLISASLAGVACAMRPAAAGLAFGTALALAIRERGPDRAWRPIVFGCVVTIVFLATNRGVAWMLHTTTATVPTAGINLYIGNNPDARLDGGGQTTLPPELDGIADPQARNDEAGRRAVAFVLSHPARAIELAVIRFVRLVGCNPGRVEVDALSRNGVPAGLTATWLAIEWALMILLAGVGCASDALTRRAFVQVSAIAAPYIFLLLITFVQTRFRLPLHLLLLPFSATGLCAIVSYWSLPGSTIKGLYSNSRSSLWFWIPPSLLAVSTVVELLSAVR